MTRFLKPSHFPSIWRFQLLRRKANGDLAFGYRRYTYVVLPHVV